MARQVVTLRLSEEEMKVLDSMIFVENDMRRLTASKNDLEYQPFDRSKYLRFLIQTRKSYLTLSGELS